MVEASSSWHPATMHGFLFEVLTVSHDLELGIDPGIATSTCLRVCWTCERAEMMGEIPAVLEAEVDNLELDLRVGK